MKRLFHSVVRSIFWFVVVFAFLLTLQGALSSPYVYSQKDGVLIASPNMTDCTGLVCSQTVSVCNNNANDTVFTPLVFSKVPVASVVVPLSQAPESVKADYAVAHPLLDRGVLVSEEPINPLVEVPLTKNFGNVTLDATTLGTGECRDYTLNFNTIFGIITKFDMNWLDPFMNATVYLSNFTADVNSTPTTASYTATAVTMPIYQSINDGTAKSCRDDTKACFTGRNTTINGQVEYTTIAYHIDTSCGLGTINVYQIYYYNDSTNQSTGYLSTIQFPQQVGTLNNPNVSKKVSRIEEWADNTAPCRADTDYAQFYVRNQTANTYWSKPLITGYGVTTATLNVTYITGYNSSDSLINVSNNGGVSWQSNVKTGQTFSFGNGNGTLIYNVVLLNNSGLAPNITQVRFDFITNYNAFLKFVLNNTATELFPNCTDNNTGLIISPIVPNYYNLNSSVSTNLVCAAGANFPSFNSTVMAVGGIYNNTISVPSYNVNINIFDELTGNKINTSTTTLAFNGLVQQYSFSTANGSYYANFLTPDTYNIVASNPLYFSRNYVLTVNGVMTLNVYLLNATNTNNQAVTYTITDLKAVPLSGVLLVSQKLSNVTLVTVENRVSDVAGQALLSQDKTSFYTLTVSLAGYVTRTISFQPIATTYVVRLSSLTGTNVNNTYSNSNYSLSPSVKVLSPGIYNFSISTTSSSGSLSYFGISQGASIVNSTSASGGLAQLSYDGSGVSTSRNVTFSYFLATNDGNSLVFNQTYIFYNYTQGGNFSLSALSGNYQSEIGSGGFLLFGVFILIGIVLVFATFVAGRVLGMIAAVVVVAFAVLGWIPWTYAFMLAFTVFFASMVKGE